MSGISSDVFHELVADLTVRIAPRTSLDIGPGRGKYGRIMRQAAPGCRTTALEISAAYVDQYGLDAVYDEVKIADAARLPLDPHGRNDLYDLITIGDCIEHMPKSQGLDLLNFLIYRCGYLIMVAPEFCYYDTSAMEYTESHIAVWSEYDLEWHDRFAFMRSEILQIFVLRGYQPSIIALHDLIAASNADPMPIHRTAGGAYKSSHLEVRTRDRPEVIDGVSWIYRPL